MKMPEFEGFHISQPSYWGSKTGMVIITCSKCKSALPTYAEHIDIATKITCSQCGFSSIKSDRIWCFEHQERCKAPDNKCKFVKDEFCKLYKKPIKSDNLRSDKDE